MKIASFQRGDGRTGVGVVDEDSARDQTVTLRDLTDAWPDVRTPLDVSLMLQHDGRDAVREASQRAQRVEVPVGELLAPVLYPSKFFAIGFNYRSHAQESGVDAPAYPLFFNKQVTCVSAPRAPITKPDNCSMLDYEGELALVIGAKCRNISADEARHVIGGWMICNDVTARDWQRQSTTITLAKSYDTFGPLGPWLVTPDEVAVPQALTITTTVNGEVRQDGSTSEMIHKICDQIATLSARCTLMPGDLLTTGSPQGSAQGLNPPPWLQPGDVVRVEIHGLGEIENVVVREGKPKYLADPFEGW